MTAKEAGREAGFIKPTHTVPQTVDGLAAFIRRKYTATEIQQLVDLLTGGGESLREFILNVNGVLSFSKAASQPLNLPSLHSSGQAP
jgi:hypothetical protein